MDYWKLAAIDLGLLLILVVFLIWVRKDIDWKRIRSDDDGI
jgi:hypothetical protein